MLGDLNQMCASCVLLLWTLTDLASASFSYGKRLHPLVRERFPKESFPEPHYDMSAPICSFEKEPCGFYSFSINGKHKFKWVNSWCRCPEKLECAFDRVDMRMRVFRHSCVPKNQTTVESNEVEFEDQPHVNRQRHRRNHKHHSHSLF
ncbi:hypothetical protein M3Y97_00473500 [Aphelenchoides bicaudatus]|nr:hypothetical protein M3Y97_00473500 [Aphelenchoides bicaudatus]